MRKLLFALALGFVFVGCDKDDEPVQYQSLDEFVSKAGNLNIFNAAIEKAGLQNFKTGGPFTWYAPNDAAFLAKGITLDSVSKMTQGTASYLITYHVLRTLVKSKDMIASFSVPRTTQQGTVLYTAGGNDAFYVNGTRIVSLNNDISSGVVHVIDKVNTPVNLVGNIASVLNSTGQHSLFIAALTKAGRMAQLGTASTFSVVAPTDAAMTAAGLTSATIASTPTIIVDSIVRYHYFVSARFFTNDFGNRNSASTALGAGRLLVGSADGFKLKGKNNATPASITTANILATNGVVHIVDGVLKY
jgi:uncharacterized surface protein with fasciclin (FAS1) repeats